MLNINSDFQWTMESYLVKKIQNQIESYQEWRQNTFICQILESFPEINSSKFLTQAPFSPLQMVLVVI